MAETKREGGKDFHRGDYAYAPNGPSTWKLRLTNTPGGAPDTRIVGAAVAALGKGFRGQKVQIPSAELSAVKKKVRAAWLKANPDKSSVDLPAVLKKEDSNMSKEILKALEGEFADGEKLQAALKEAEVSEKGVEAATAIARILTAYKDELPENLPQFLGYPEPEPKVIEKIVEVEKKEKSDEEKKAEVLKGVEDPEARAQIEKIWESNKTLAEKQADLERTLKAEQEAKEIKEFVEKAEKELPNLPAKAEEVGPALRVLKQASPEQLELITRLLKAGDEAILKAKEAVGSPGSDSTEKATYTELVTKAEEMVAKGEAKTKEMAIQKMVSTDPSIYERYLTEA